MWPGGGKASDACTTVPALPRACTGRRTGYLLPGPRHNRTEGQKTAAPSCSLHGSTVKDEGEDRGRAHGRAPNRPTSFQSQNEKPFSFLCMFGDGYADYVCAVHTGHSCKKDYE